MTWLGAAAAGATPLDRTFGLVPAAYARFRELHARLWDGATLDPVVLELCRRRVGALLGCQGSDGLPGGVALDAAQAANLPRWPTSPRFCAVQRACLVFAEQYVLDPHAITDADVGALRAHLPPPALATLVLAIAVFESLGRLRLALEVAPA